jgi:ribosomal protein S18 acetylase RimI-like enzyme
MSAIEIRNMRESDIEEVIALAMNTLPEALRDELGVILTKERLTSFISRIAAATLVAVRQSGDQEIVGASVATYSSDLRTVQIHFVAVDPNCRRQGIGVALIKETTAQNFGCTNGWFPKFHITIPRASNPAPGDIRTFFKKCGFGEPEPFMQFTNLPR